MKAVLLDAWYDLRRKRLLPVALLLVAALIAIPAFMLKPADADTEVPSATSPAPQTAPTQLAVTTEGEPGTGSNLGVFDPEDPFKPDADALPPAGAGIAEVVVEETEPAGGGGQIDVEIGPEPDISPPPTPAPTPAPRRVTKSYEYVVDATVWTGDRRRTVKDLRKLDMLPNQATPMLIFMGASQDGGNATFMVDATLQATGEGSCRPSRADCALVAIGPGAEEVFTDESGASYRLRVDEIRKVLLKAGSSRDASANASVQSRRRFVPPFLPDVVIEAETVVSPSSTEPNGR
jgi:hypothetical protein